MDPTSRLYLPCVVPTTLKHDKVGKRDHQTVVQSTEPVFKRYDDREPQKPLLPRHKEDPFAGATHSRGQKRGREEDQSERHAKTPRINNPSRPVVERKNHEHPDTTSRSPIEERTVRVQEHFLPMKGAIYMEYIRDGKKKYEGRVNGFACQKMQIGDNLRLFDNGARWGIVCKITSVTIYNSFQMMLEKNGILNMLPQLEKQSKTLSPNHLMEEAVKIYKAFPGSNRVTTCGVAAIGVQFIKTIYSRQG